MGGCHSADSLFMKMGKDRKMCIRDRFNYADRDPLTNNAHVTDVTKDVFENLNRD